MYNILYSATRRQLHYTKYDEESQTPPRAHWRGPRRASITGLGLLAVLLTGSAVLSAQTVNITEYAPPTASAVPWVITAGPDGALWFTETQANKIGRITTAGVFTEYPIPTASSSAADIVAGPDGALWFVENKTSKIGRITTSGTFTEYNVPTSNSSPYGMTVGPDGALWFTEIDGNQIGRITTAGVFTEYPIQTSLSHPYGITAGQDGALWFVENLTNFVARITTSGLITEYAIPTANSLPATITAGPDGALWFTEFNTNKIGRITTSGAITEFPVTASTNPQGIATGGDGALWFTEFSGNKIGRITTSGVVTEYALLTNSAGPWSITAGPDHALWYTELNANIGRVGLTTALMTSPAPGTALSGASATFTWTAATGATAYWLDVNSTCAGCGGTIFGQNVGNSTSQTVTGLPTFGGTVYVRLWTLLSGGWQYNDYQYTAPTLGGSKAAMTSPTPGTTLGGASVTFVWAPGTNASAYWLDVNNTCAGCGGAIYGKNEALATTQTVTGIPVNGGPIYVRLWTLLGGNWQSTDYTYTAAAGNKSTLTSPTPGSTLTSTSATFVWTSVSTASAYWLDVNSACAGCGGIIYGQNEGLNTTQTVTGLPLGGTIYVRLWTQISGIWSFNDYSFTAGGGTKATMTTPVPGTLLSGSSVTFTWAAGTGASAYWLDVNNSCAGCGGGIFGQNVGTVTTQTVTGIPTTGTIYVRLWTLLGGTWQSNDYSYVASGSGTKATLTSPTPGSTLTGASVTFSWSPGAGASAYWLDVNTACAGCGGIIFGQNVGTVTSQTVSGLPVTGGPVYVRLWTLLGGTWQSNDYTYTAF